MNLTILSFEEAKDLLSDVIWHSSNAKVVSDITDTSFQESIKDLEIPEGTTVNELWSELDGYIDAFLG